MRPGRRSRQRNGMRDLSSVSSLESMLPGGVDLTLSELQDMAARQQQQIEAQQQILVAKEQRLKYLKQQEQKQQQLASENERIKKLREKVDAQEMKLKKLRALRGQVEQHKTSNENLNSELEAIKALFNEKEKEFAMAVTKVEEMTRQLEEIRSGKINANVRNQTAAAAELEKLKKELTMRNKLNEQQNQKLAQHRELLIKKREEVAKMDNRIQELQQRLKRKRAQQTQRNKQQINQQNLLNKVNLNRPPPTNIAAVEPYQQQVSKDKMEEENGATPGFAKQNPKYQSLPPSSKFPFLDKSKIEESSSKPRETNNNMIDPNGKKSDTDRQEDYSIPLVVSVDSNMGKQNGPSSGASFASERPAGTQNSVFPPSSGGQNYSQPSASSTQTLRYPPPVPSRSGLSHLTPRPFGSTYSTSILGNRPQINVPDEVRQGGSGQSSPASSDGSQKENSPSDANITSNDLQNKSSFSAKNKEQSPKPLPSKEAWGLNVAKASSEPPVLPSRPTGNNRPYPPFSEQLNINSTTPSTNQQIGRTVGSQNIPKGNQQIISPGSSIAQPVLNKFDNKDHAIEKSLASPDNIAKTNGASSISTTSTSTGGFSTLNHAAVLGSMGHKPVMPYRYAPKSVIANTYLGNKINSEVLEKYQQNVKNMYKEFDSSEKSQLEESSVDDSVKSVKIIGPIPNRTNSNFGESGSNHSSPLSSNSSASPSSPSAVAKYQQFDFPSSPPHADVASDKVSIKPNTPKHIRKRHSDSDNEDITKALNQYDQMQSANIVPVPAQENQLLTLEDKNGAIEIQATSFSDRIPETVLLDNKGNIIEVNDSSAGQSSKDSDSSSSSSSSSLSSSSSIQNRAPTVIEVQSDSSEIKKKTNLKSKNSKGSGCRVSFDPLALLLDASLEGELELVKRCAEKVENVSEPNDEGITALHNAICAGHYDIVTFLIEFGCDVNSPDSDGWTPLHCAASCNNLPMVKFLVEHGACIFATTISDHETAAEKCEEDEDGYDGCSEYLYSIQEKLGITNNGAVYAVFDYDAKNPDELLFKINDQLFVLRKGDDKEKEWWWAKKGDQEGYIPRNLLGMYPRVLPRVTESSEC
ncbi:hypothetical protein ACJMK2_037540 [Sinanodonta woodiana]|uniref:SH3 domain-containing protein n=1 Tax=Sinanodonta woodiana TaxID=1069815 RepID=A0ABD3WKQ2_SINWO